MRKGVKAVQKAIFAALGSVLAVSVAQADCAGQPDGNYGVPLWRAGVAYGFETSGLAVDADGAADSYRVDGKGLSDTCDGVFALRNGAAVTQKTDKAGWLAACRAAWAKAQATNDYTGVKIVGFKHDCPGPCVQKDGDPLPGQAYVTTTSMTVPNTPMGTQRHYVDASAIPYVVLPPALAAHARLALGDVVAVYRPKTGTTAFAVYAECCGAGEASVKLHQDLGNDPIRKEPDGTRRAKGGIADRIVTVLFPGQHPVPSTDSAAWYKQIQDVGSAALMKWGGTDRLRSCAR